jgi:hypothetical protein
LFIHADTLFSINDSLGEPSIIQAYYGVKIFQNSIQGKCDSLIYDKSKDVLQLFIEPILWSFKGELKGDTMLVFLNDSVIDRTEISCNSTALFQVDTIGYYNQIAGKKMIAYFKDNDVYRADTKGNAQTIYYLEETVENDTNVIVKRMGMNRLYASDIRVYFDSGEVIGVTYYDKPDGKFYPIDQIDKREQFVPNFNWNPLLRPKRWQEMIK